MRTRTLLASLLITGLAIGVAHAAPTVKLGDPQTVPFTQHVLTALAYWPHMHQTATHKRLAALADDLSSSYFPIDNDGDGRADPAGGRQSEIVDVTGDGIPDVVIAADLDGDGAPELYLLLGAPQRRTSKTFQKQTDSDIAECAWIADHAADIAPESAKEVAHAKESLEVMVETMPFR